MKSRGLREVTRSPPNSETTVPSLRSLVTPTDSFFVRSHFPVPQVDVKGWQLQVGGEVGSAKTFTYEQLGMLSKVEVMATLECAGNGRSYFPRPAEGELQWGTGAVGTSVWKGVRLSKLLELTGLRDGATQVVAEGFDSGTPPGMKERVSFTRALPLVKALASETLVALEMNGRPLAPERGFPARLLVPGWYGMASVKWLSKITVIGGEPYSAFFNGVKYVYVYDKKGEEVRDPVTTVRVNSLITEPLEGERVGRGRPVVVRGKAWSGAGRVVSVEVDLGEGWEKAELGNDLGQFAWSTWSKRWVPSKKGRTVISARATDRKGNVQPLEPFENRYQYGCNVARKVSVEVF